MVGQTPLHLIAANGRRASVSVARVLLTNGAHISARNVQGWDRTVYSQHGPEIYDLISTIARRNA
jgi:hypothetical protein